MTCTPGSHSTIVDLAKSAFGYTSSLGDRGQTLDAWILGVKARGIRGWAVSDASIRLEGFVRLRILPGHLLSTGDLAVSL